MEINKRCGNCGKYPLCEKTSGASGVCENWKKKPREMKLESIDKLNFQFKEV